MLIRRLRGFTVVEILVSLALIAIISAVLVPALMSRIRDARTSALGQTLFSLSLALVEYRKAVGAYPPQLIYLSQKPAATTTDACGTPGGIGATNANKWRGPYVARDLVSTGVNVGDARIVDTLTYVSGTPSRLFINVTTVDTLSAVDLERQFDGTPGNSSTGTLRYQKTAIVSPPIPAAAAGEVNLQYGIPISGC